MNQRQSGWLIWKQQGLTRFTAATLYPNEEMRFAVKFRQVIIQ